MHGDARRPDRGDNASPREEKISGERVYAGRVLSLEVDRVRLAGGGEAVREVVRHPGAAVVVPVLDDGRVVMVRQFRYAAGETLLELPAGKRDGGEDPAACAARELAEETGLQAARLDYLTGFFTAPGFTDEFIHCFLACGLTPAVGAVRDADEELELLAVTIDEARRLIASGEIRDAKTIIGLLLLGAAEIQHPRQLLNGEALPAGHPPGVV